MISSPAMLRTLVLLNIRCYSTKSTHTKTDFKGYQFVNDVVVCWGDQDKFGHVNNVNFFRYFEDARILFMTEVFKPVLDPQSFEGFIDAKEIGPILGKASCVYKAPIKYPDTVRIGTKISDLGVDRWTMNHKMVSLTTNRVVAEGEMLIVTYDYRIRKRANIPPKILEVLQNLPVIQ